MGVTSSARGVVRRDELSKKSLAWQSSCRLRRGNRVEEEWITPFQADIDLVYDVREDEILGRGKYGIVRRGVHLRDGSQVAIKSVEKRILEDFERMRMEIQALQLVQHPNILSLEAVFEGLHTIHLVTDLFCGGEVFTKIEEDVWEYDERVSAHVMKQVIDAVIYLHSAHNIIHRDLKPENFMFKNKGEKQVKLIDFGLATIAEEHQVLTELVGTSYYVAPEVLDRAYNRSCDVWSIGISAYVLLTGEAPFDGEKTTDILNAIRKKKTPRFERGEDKIVVSPEGIDFVKQLCDPFPKSRISLRDALDHSWIQKFAVPP